MSALQIVLVLLIVGGIGLVLWLLFGRTLLNRWTSKRMQPYIRAASPTNALLNSGTMLELVV